nr:unnamed protein product [Callosobruchus analis]
MQTPPPLQPGPSGTRKRRRLPVYLLSSDSDDDDSLRNTSSSEGEETSFNESFREILPTPVIEEKKVIPRKKYLNYRAQKVTKALLFDEQVKKKNETGKSKKIIKNNKVVEAWYCHLCDEDKVRDLRLCSMCSRYVHEECVGLTKMDREPTFICPSCS